MDFVMKIIVSLVVILAVGGTLLTVSTDLLHNSQKNIEGVGNIDSQDKMIEKPSFNENEIKILAQECFDNNYGIRNEESLCYILKADTSIDVGSMSFDSPPVSSWSGNSKTIYIKYSIGNNVTISD